MLLPTTSIRVCWASIPLTPVCSALILAFLQLPDLRAGEHRLSAGRSSLLALPFGPEERPLKHRLDVVERYLLMLDQEQGRGAVQTHAADDALGSRAARVLELDLAAHQL